MRLPHPALGLIGRVFAILLLAVLVEYGASTFLYERASQFSVEQDEARRLAEHLFIAAKLIEEEEPAGRAAASAELTTTRYAIGWRAALPKPPPLAPALDRLTHQILDWEPALAARALRLSLTSPGRDGFIAGTLRLADGSWITFRTRQPVAQLDMAASRVLLALTPAVALILIGGLLVRQTLRPMRDLAEAADRVGHGAIEVEPVPERGPSEVRDTIVAFNAMQARIHALLADRTQALAAVGHDFRTPLARLRLRADEIGDAPLRDAVRHDVTEMDQMVASLLAYLAGEDEAEPPAPTDLAVLCATLVDDAEDRGHAAAYHGPDHCELAVRRVALKRALTNLVENALHFGTRVDLRLAAHDDTVTISVEDDGPGIPPADRVRALEPFVRLDPARGRDTEGFGLGLAIVARTVAAHGGQFTLETAPAGGLAARITLPR